MSDSEQEPKTAPATVSEGEAPTVIRSASSAQSDAETWLSTSAREKSGFTVPAPGHTLAGRYMVFDLLGRGGMGVVLAAYDTRLDRRVALKLLRIQEDSTPSTSGGEARLVREAQAMARLNHPHVVAVYDAGPLEDGSLFIAMEYVEGQTLRRWSEQQPRPWREVLEAFLAAGKGLAAAHAAGLIHRDFKPDNVLVGQDGRVRVTDFGLARADPGPSASEKTLASLAPDSLNSALTEPGTLMGTPKYMAPELMRGEPAGIRTDLYSFCVSLYEVLYRQLPFEGSSMAEYFRARREGRITPPPAQSEVPAWVARTVQQGLHVDPLQRPASMEALLAALQDDPDVKRRARRRVAAVASAGLVLAVLALWGWARQRVQEPMCSRVELRLDGVWDAAVKARVSEALLGTGLSYAQATAERVSASLDGYAERWVKQGVALCEAEQAGQLPRLAALRESCLERRRSRLRATTELLARGSDRELLEKAVQAVQSLPPLEDCVDDRALTAVPPPEDPAVRAAVEALLGQVDPIEALLGAGKYKEGLSAAERLLAQVAPLGHPPLHAQVLFLLARLKNGAADYKGAEEFTRQALAEAARGRDLALMSRALSLQVVVVGATQQRPQDVAPLLPVLQALAESTGDALTQAIAFSSMGRVLMLQGKYPEALEHHSQALALRQKTLGPEHPEVASSLTEVSRCTWWLGRYDEASEQAERALALNEKALGPEHPDIVRMLINTSATLYELGRYEEALQRLERSLVLQEKITGPEHPVVSRILSNIGIVLMPLGRYEEALDRARRSLALTEKLQGADHPQAASSLMSLGNALSELGRHKEALEHYERGLALRQKALGPEHALVSETLRHRASALIYMGRYSEAREQLERALAIHERVLGREHPDIAYTLAVQAALMLAWGRPAEALPVLERAMKLSPAGGIRAELDFSLARALWEVKRTERARAVALATDALGYWQRFGHKPKVAEASKWLATHPAP